MTDFTHTNEGDNNMSKFINLSEDIAIATENTRSPYAWDAQREALEWLDSHPDQVPGRTITESDFCEAVDKTHEWTDEGFARTVLNRLGITVTPDPKPTNAGKLANDLEEWGMSRGTALNLAPWLAGQGWVADD